MYIKWYERELLYKNINMHGVKKCLKKKRKKTLTHAITSEEV